MEPVDSPSPEPSSEDTSEDGSEDGLISVPDPVKHCYRVRAMGEAKKAGPALQALIDLSHGDCPCTGARSQTTGGNGHALC